MDQLPVLPRGFVAQPVWVRAGRDHHHEFALLYGPDGRLDRERSYWMQLRQGPAESARVSYVSWGRLCDELGNRAPAFARFCAYGVPLAELETWFEEGAQRAGEPTDVEVADTRGGRLPWQWSGLRRVDGRWRRVSGVVPSEGPLDRVDGVAGVDGEDPARTAAALLEAEVVVLEDGLHRVLAVRDAAGQPLGAPDPSLASLLSPAASEEPAV